MQDAPPSATSELAFTRPHLDCRGVEPPQPRVNWRLLARIWIAEGWNRAGWTL